MPVSVVRESTANAVSAALRESLGGGGGGGNNGSCSADAKAAVGGMSASSPLSSAGGNGSATDVDSLQNKLVASAKRVLLSKIEYEEGNSYSQSVLETFKSKYIVLKPNPAMSMNGGGGGGGGTTNGSGNNNGKAENGRVSASGGATCNGSGGGIINGSTADVNGNTATGGVGGCNNTIKRLTGGAANNNNPNELPQPKRILFAREDVRIGWKSTSASASSRKWQVGVGMTNVGNTCYLNSTLQAIFHVPSMANWLMSDAQHREQCETSDAVCIICAMAKTLMASQSNQSAIRPYYVYSKLKSICKHLVMGRQEDAHEFLRYLVEAMEKSYLTRFRNHKELDQYSKETTPLNQILGGYLRSAVRCLSCSHVSVTFQHFQDLLLDIRKADSIEEALEGYFARERLEDMGYKCESCKKKVSATKQFSLERAPIALCIQLKRFSIIGTKLNKQITIKPRLDLSKFASRKPSGEQLTYKLVAMVTHLGASQHCGHYTAIGVTESGTYYNYDDSYVRPISMQNVCNTNAYIIFYELDTTPVARQVTSTQISGAESKENYQKLNGFAACNQLQQQQQSNTAISPQRPIGPQLPPNGLKSYNANSSSPYANGGGGGSGSKMSIHRQGAIPTGSPSLGGGGGGVTNSKIMIHFKNSNNTNGASSGTIVKTSAATSSTTTTTAATTTTLNSSVGNNNNKQNGLQSGTGNFQEPANAKPALAGPSAKTQTAAIANGNNESCSSSSADNEIEMMNNSTNTPMQTERRNGGVAGSNATSTITNTTSSAAKATLPSMPKLFETSSSPSMNGRSKAAVASGSTSSSSNTPPKSLVPYGSEESDDDDSSAVIMDSSDVLKRSAKSSAATMTTTTTTATATAAAGGKNPLKRRNSSSSSSASTDGGEHADADEKPTNGLKVKKAGAATTSAAHMNGGGGGSPTKAKQKTDGAAANSTADSSNSSAKPSTAGRSNNNNNNHNSNNSNLAPTKQQANGKSHAQQFVFGKAAAVVNDDYPDGDMNGHNNEADDDNDDEDDDDDDDAHNSRPPFKRSHSTPPSPPVIKTKTGYWQVTTLTTENTSSDADGGGDGGKSSSSKNPRNPFGQASKSTGDLFAKRGKSDKAQPPTRNGGYQRDSASDTAINELLKQSHRGYGAPVLTWEGGQAEIEREVTAEAREQRQRDRKDEQENEQDRGRQKKVKSKDNASSSATALPSGYNPFQEQDNQRRWAKQHGGSGGSGGGGASAASSQQSQRGFHIGHFRNQFQRNKFKFQRFNHKFQRLPYQRSSGSTAGGGGGSHTGGGYNRRDS